MKKKTFSQIAFLLAALTAAQILASCGNESQTQNNTTPSTNQDISSEVTTADEPNKKNGLWYADYLPEKDYDGYTFRVVSVDILPTDVAEETNDIVNDSYYQRNRKIEEKYNIEFEQNTVASWDEQTKVFKKSAMAVSPDFDLCRVIMRDAFPFVLQGYAASPDMLPYIDMSKPWYIKYVNDALTIENKNILAYSDECIGALTGVLCVFFNQKMCQDLGLQSPYELVDNGTWTIDRFYEYAEAASSDLNSDSKFDFDNDRYGVIAEHDMFIPSMWIGANIRTVEKDENDFPYFAANGNEKLYDLMTGVSEFFNKDGMCYDILLKKGYGNDGGESNRLAARIGFSNGKSLFNITGFGSSSDLREMRDDFGIIPLPKYDKEQERYFSRLCDGWINIALACSEDLERTSIILEALAVETKNIVIPAIYDKAIQNKYIRDEKSLEMLELIQENRSVDLGDTVWMDPVREIFVGPVRQKKTDFASNVAKNLGQVDKAFARLRKQIDEFDSAE